MASNPLAVPESSDINRTVIWLVTLLVMFGRVPVKSPDNLIPIRGEFTSGPSNICKHEL